MKLSGVKASLEDGELYNNIIIGTNHKEIQRSDHGECIDNPLMTTTNHHYFEFLTPAVTFCECQVEYILTERIRLLVR